MGFKKRRVIIGPEQVYLINSIYTLEDYIEETNRRLDKLEKLAEAESYRYETKLVKIDEDD